LGENNISADTSSYVSECLQLALLLEVSAYPKPGNVHRNADFGDTRYEHFLASAVAVAPHFKLAAERGVKLYNGIISEAQVGLGELIRDSAKNMRRWQTGGNTLLGAVILLMPIAVAAGAVLAEGKFSLSRLREEISRIVASSTAKDAVNVYEAIDIAQPGGLGKAPDLDVNDSRSKKRIIEENISLYQVFKIASAYDSICAEWVNNYPITFDIGYPFFKRQIEKANDVNLATVNTFLKILAEVPDTLIARKAGKEKAVKVSLEAKRILELGGLETEVGRKELVEFDHRLRQTGNNLNPGTTADIVSAVLALNILEGYRP